MHTTKTKVAVIGAALAGAVAVALSTTSPALAFSSGGLYLDVTIAQSPATLVTRGAAIDVPVRIDCTATEPGAFVSVSVTQRVGSQIATGYGSALVECTDSGQVKPIRVTANAGKAFAKHDAVATADISGCRETTCGSESTTNTIQVNK
ncbi:MAG: hypothetical protein WCG47_09545 [Dermatophilaceae bacterium]